MPSTEKIISLVIIVQLQVLLMYGQYSASPTLTPYNHHCFYNGDPEAHETKMSYQCTPTIIRWRIFNVELHYVLFGLFNHITDYHVCVIIRV